MYKKILETALLGTERSQLKEGMLPEAVENILSKSTSSDEESKLLEAMAVSAFYLDAGKIPQEYTGVLDDTPIEEDKAEAPEKLQKVLLTILDMSSQIRRPLLELWMDAIINLNYVTGYKTINRLIQASLHMNRDIKDKVAQVIGNKGRSILPYFPEFGKNLKVESEVGWTDGLSKERQTILVRYLKENPSKALELLSSTWQQEAIVTKKSFLDTISEYPSPEFIPFIEDLYKQEFALKPNEKKTEQLCRNLTARILLRYPDSELCRSTFKDLSSCFDVSVKKGLLGLGSGTTIKIQLPDNENDFFNTENMLKTYGVNMAEYDIALFKTDIQHAFSFFLEEIPLNDFSQMLDVEPERLVKAIIEDKELTFKIKGNEIPMFRRSLVVNAKNRKDASLAAIIVDKLPIAEALGVFHHLAYEDYEAFVIKHKYLTDLSVLVSCPHKNKGDQWTADFSKRVINAMFDKVSQTPGMVLAGFGHEIALIVHPGAYDTLNACLSKAQNQPYHGKWENNMHEPITSIIDIRKILEEYIR